MRSNGAPPGFSLIELLIVLLIVGVIAAIALPRFLDLSDDAERVSVEAQANALRSNDRINIAACKAGSEECIDITSQGDQACEDALEAFLPSLDREVWHVRNIDSNVPSGQWGELTESGEAVFTVTRFLGPDASQHPGDAWFETWNARQPCILSRA